MSIAPSKDYEEAVYRLETPDLGPESLPHSPALLGDPRLFAECF